MGTDLRRKRRRPTLWLSEDGTRVGTYEVHNGAVWHLDVSWDSKLLVSGSADMHAKVWDVETARVDDLRTHW